jgi:hypothetical protein
MYNYIVNGCSASTPNNNLVVISRFTGDTQILRSTPQISINKNNNEYHVIITSLLPSPVIEFFVNFDPVNVSYSNDINNYISVTMSNRIISATPNNLCNIRIDRNTYVSITVTFVNDIDVYSAKDEIVIGVANDFSKRVVANAEIFSGKNRSISNDTQITPMIDNDNNNDQCDKTAVPKILIEGQTFNNGSDIANINFTIIDKFQYYKDESIVGTKCGYFYTKVDKLKETTFLKCCDSISLFNVLKGKGKNTLEKAEYLYSKNEDELKDIGFIKFYYNNLILYSMTRYILSKILYGNFNINYLLDKYNEQFLNDLQHSRFCTFLQLFEDCNAFKSYNRFFKYDLDKNNKK